MSQSIGNREMSKNSSKWMYHGRTLYDLESTGDHKLYFLVKYCIKTSCLLNTQFSVIEDIKCKVGIEQRRKKERDLLNKVLNAKVRLGYKLERNGYVGSNRNHWFIKVF